MVAKMLPRTAAFVPSSVPYARLMNPRQLDHSHRRSAHHAATFDILMSMSVDDSLASSILDSSHVTLATTTASGITPVQEFEPVLNTQAASSFVIIAVVFTLLQLRINAVSNAAQRRSAALEALRKAESLQLSATDGGLKASDRPNEEQVALARSEYENALKEELGLRTIIPGVRIVAPNDPKRDEEERAAAKRFLGWGSEEFGDEDDSEYDVDSNNNKQQLDSGDRGSRSVQKDESGNNAGMSNGAQLLLFGVASMLIVLLWTLSFDPMVADQVFTSVGGNPPDGMPLSSW